MLLGREIAIVTDAAEVREELSHGDRPLLLRKRWHVLLHLGIEIDASFFRELENGDGSHRLRHRGEAVRRFGSRGSAVFDVRESEPVTPYEVVFHHRDGEAGHVRGCELLLRERLEFAELLVARLRMSNARDE